MTGDQPDEQAVEDTNRRTVVQWLAARSMRQLALGAGVVVLLVSGLFGGLRQAQAEEPDKLALGKPHLSEPVNLTVKSVRWSDDLGEAIGPSEFGRYVVVIADVSTDQENSVESSVIRESLGLTGVDGLAEAPGAVPARTAEPRVLVTEDRVPLAEVGPGLTYEVAFIWEQKTSEPVPTEVGLVTRSHSLRPGYVDGRVAWFDPVDDAVGTFPVTEFMGAA